jgi:cell division protein FtsB
MSLRSPIFQLARTAALPAVAMLIIGYFASSALIGPNGVFALGGYKAALQQKTAVLKKTVAYRDTLHHRAKLLDPAHVDSDYGDELVRRTTGQIRPDEVIIPRN